MRILTEILFRKKKKELSLPLIAFLQALGLVVYCILVGLVFWRGETWFGPLFSFLGLALFLVLFVVSALICALLVLGYPFILFWERKQPTEALKLVACTTAWLVFFILLIILILSACQTTTLAFF